MFKWNANNIIDATCGRRVGNYNWICSSGVSTDTRNIRTGDLFIALKGKNFDGHNFLHKAFSKGAVAAVVSRPLAEPVYDEKFLGEVQTSTAEYLDVFEERIQALTTKLPSEIELCKRSSDKKEQGFPLIIVENTLKALHNMALYYIRNVLVNTKVIAITGSVGKTTTKDMLYTALSQYGISHVNEGNLNNNIGLPLTVLKAQENCQYLILEMGMNKAGEIKELSEICNPDIAVITNIEPAHTENFLSLLDIAKAKLEVLHGMKNNGILILNKDNKYYDYLSSHSNRNVVNFSKNKNASVRLFGLMRNNTLPSVIPVLDTGIQKKKTWIPVSYAQLYECCNLKVQQTISSQCQALGSRYKSICKLYNGQWILEASIKNNIYDEIIWIPVSRTGMTGKKVLDDNLTAFDTQHSYSCAPRAGMTSNRAAKGLSLKIRLSNNQIIDCNLNVQGEHFAYSALTVAAVVQSLRLDLSKLPPALETFNVTHGRGNIYEIEYNRQHICVIDDSYNASPASMKAAIKTLGSYSDQRKVAFLGDMLELGDESVKFHIKLLDFIIEHTIDKVYTVGKLMFELYRLLPSDIKGVHFDDSNQLKDDLTEIIQDNDIILIKGSRGMQMDFIVQKILSS